MKKKFTLLSIALLFAITSAFGVSSNFPKIDAQRVAERVAGVNKTHLLSDRSNSRDIFSQATAYKRYAKPVNPFEAIMNASTSVDNVEGLQVFNIDDNYDTWWKLDTSTGTSKELWSNEYLAGYNYNAGFVRDGVVYAVTGETGYILKYDVATGDYLGYVALGSEYNKWILHTAYNEENDIVYVYTYNAAGNGLEFQIYDPVENKFTSIREEVGEGTLADDPIVAMAYNPLDGQVYAVTLNNELWIRIDPATGLWDEIAVLDFSPASYVQAMVYTPNNFSFTYIGINLNDETYQLVVDPETGAITSRIRMTDEAEYVILHCYDQAIVNGAANAPQIDSIVFEGAATYGVLNIVAPTTANDNSPLEAELSLVVSIDETVYDTRTVTAGQSVEVALNNMTEGVHTLTAYCVHNGVDGAKAEQTFFVGYDTPATPQNVVLTETLVTWDPVTTGQNNGNLESDVVTYNVYIGGEKMNDEPIVENSFVLDLQIATMSQIQAEVEAVCVDKVSERGLSNILAVGSYTIPLDLPITEDVLKYIKVYDVNDDNSTWAWSTDEKAFVYTYNSYKDADDWAVLHKTTFPLSKQLYRIDIDVRSGYDFYPEKFEIGICKSGKIEDMQIVVPETIVASEEVITLGGQFKLEEAGDYFIGIHAISDADNYILTLKKIAVTMAEAPNTVPEACTNIEATAAEYGALSAHVEFDLPMFALSGDELNPESDVTVTVSSEGGSVKVTGKPGEHLQADVPTIQGVNTITLLTENENGVGAESSISLYTGVDIPLPATLTSLNISADNRTMTFSWETSTVGVNGGFVDPAFCTYTILIYYPEVNYWFTQAGPGYDGTEYSYTVPEGTPLKTVSLAVTTQNAAGNMQEGPMAVASLGVPYQMPMEELFENMQVAYGPLTIEHPSEEYSGSWDIVNPAAYVSKASNDSGASLVSFAEEDGETYSQLVLPKFNPQTNEEVKVEVRAYLYDNMADAVVYARGYDNQAVALGTISMGEEDEEGWKTFTFFLPEDVKDWQWTELVVRASFTDKTQYLLIDKYAINIFTGVEQQFMTNEPMIYGVKNAIVVENADTQSIINVFTVDGKQVATRKAEVSYVAIEVEKGIYIVRYADKTAKVVVR